MPTILWPLLFYRKPTIVTKYVESGDEKPMDENVNEKAASENSENDITMQSLPKGNVH